MAISEFRHTSTKWKVLRTGLTGLADADWAEDVSDALPTTGLAATPFYRAEGMGKNTQVEFVVFAYVAATGLLVDLSAETFSVDVTFFELPADVVADDGGNSSNIVGRTTSGEKVAIRQVSSAGHLFNVIYRFPCSGADSWTLRLHTLSGAPSGADRYEVWYREAVD